MYWGNRNFDSHTSAQMSFTTAMTKYSVGYRMVDFIFNFKLDIKSNYHFCLFTSIILQKAANVLSQLPIKFNVLVFALKTSSPINLIYQYCGTRSSLLFTTLQWWN